MSLTVPQICLASTASVGAGTLNRVASAAIATTRHAQGKRSPIDTAFDSLLVVTQLAVSSNATWRPEHGLILSSSAVAAAEDYFRSILTEVVELCSLCEARIRPLETRMEFVFSKSVPDAVRGMLELESFSSRENLLSWTKKFTGSNLEKELSLDVALREFERVCHIRHAAMHAGGYVSSRNAAVLSVPPGSWISFSSPTAIHEIIAVVAATLRAYNQSLFEKILEGWLREGLLVGDWGSDKVRFEPLWRAFRSVGDISSSHLPGGEKLKRNAFHVYLGVQSDFAARAKAASGS